MKNLDLSIDLISYTGSNSNDPLDAIKIFNRIQETAITAVSRQQLQIADSTTDLSISLPDPSSDYLLILIDRDISIKLNDWTNPLALKTRANGKTTLAFYTKGPLTSLSISNASGDVANVDIFLANK